LVGCEFWRFGMTLFAIGAVSPWLAMVDHDKFDRFVDTVELSTSDDRLLSLSCHRGSVHPSGV
jgi:hypothetical protein